MESYKSQEQELSDSDKMSELKAIVLRYCMDESGFTIISAR